MSDESFHSLSCKFICYVCGDKLPLKGKKDNPYLGTKIDYKKCVNANNRNPIKLKWPLIFDESLDDNFDHNICQKCYKRILRWTPEKTKIDSFIKHKRFELRTFTDHVNKNEFDTKFNCNICQIFAPKIKQIPEITRNSENYLKVRSTEIETLTKEKDMILNKPNFKRIKRINIVKSSIKVELSNLIKFY